MESEFVTIKEAAIRLRIHVETMRRMVREKKLPSRKVGKKYLIASADMDRLLELAARPDGTPMPAK